SEKERLIDKLDPTLLQFYAPPEVALNHYMTSLINVATAREFFGLQNVQTGNLQTTINEYLVKQVRRKHLALEDMDTAAGILEGIFKIRKNDTGAQCVDAWIDSTYLLTLAQVISTATQLSDQMFSVAKNGYITHFGAAIKVAFKKTSLTME